VSTQPPATFPTVFYSWQSDLPKEVCRNFIEDALKRATKQLCKESEVSMDPRIDRDTKDEPGSPDIVKIIERKIELAKAFVGDVSIVAKNVGGRDKWLPNASVTTETGFAISSLGERRVVLPFNCAFGDPNDLPFDLRNRRVLPYTLAPRAQDESDEEWVERRSEPRKHLVEALVGALRCIFEKGDDPPPPTAFERHALLVRQQEALERRLQPRSLTAEQRAKIVAGLSAFKGQHLKFLSGSNDSEGDRYKREIASALRDAGWLFDRSGLETVSLSMNATGVGIVVNRADIVTVTSTRAAAERLATVLRDVGVIPKAEVEAPSKGTPPPSGTILLVVGHRPTA
jgi:hypothetical protein